MVAFASIPTYVFKVSTSYKYYVILERHAQLTKELELCHSVTQIFFTRNCIFTEKIVQNRLICLLINVNFSSTFFQFPIYSTVSTKFKYRYFVFLCKMLQTYFVALNFENRRRIKGKGLLLLLWYSATVFFVTQRNV